VLRCVGGRADRKRLDLLMVLWIIAALIVLLTSLMWIYPGDPPSFA